MWFSYRRGDGSSYQIGTSKKTLNSPWQEVQPILSVTNSGNDWDSEMKEYPFVWKHKGQIYMLYNGNSFGKSGFGIATANFETNHDV